MSTDEAPAVYLNRAASNATVHGPDLTAAAEVLTFHQKLPQYRETPLHSLPSVARELGLGHVLIKDESNRFGLPSFKILGASWAVFNALTERLSLDPHHVLHTPQDPASLWTHLGSEATSEGLTLVTCTEGNWGRAVACMAKYVRVPAIIFVPSFMPETTRNRIRSEGAELVVIDGDYDDSVAAARKKADSDRQAVLVMDMGWHGYEKFHRYTIPRSYDVGPKLTLAFACSGWWKDTVRCSTRQTPRYRQCYRECRQPTPSYRWVLVPSPRQ